MSGEHEQQGDEQLLDGELLEKMIEMQRLDDKIARSNKTKTKRPKELNMRVEARDAQAAKLDAAKQIVTDAKKRIDALNVESQTLQADVTKLEGQLFNLKTNAEFEAMKQQIKTRGKQDEDIQDKILELMMAQDDLVEVQKQEEETLKEQEGLLADAERRTKEDLARAEERIAELGARKEEIQAAIPSNMRELYESIRSRRDGIGLAAVEDEICKGCDTRVTMQVYSQIIGKRLCQCPHCDRILYVR